MRRSLAINLDFTQIHAHVDILLCSYGFHIRPVVTNGNITCAYLNANAAFFGPYFFAYVNITIFSREIYISVSRRNRCPYVDIPCSSSHDNILRSTNIMTNIDIALRSFYTYGSCYIHICIKVYTSLFLHFSYQILFGLNTV